MHVGRGTWEWERTVWLRGKVGSRWLRQGQAKELVLLGRALGLAGRTGQKGLQVQGRMQVGSRTGVTVELQPGVARTSFLTADGSTHMFCVISPMLTPLLSTHGTGDLR